MSRPVKVDPEVVARHLKVLAEAKRALLAMGEELLETDPSKAGTVLNICRAITTSSKQLVNSIKT